MVLTMMAGVVRKNSSRKRRMLRRTQRSHQRDPHTDRFSLDLTDVNLRVLLPFTHTEVILSSRKVTKAMPSLFMEMRFFSALNSSVRFSSNSL
ncbi:hypothetical protein EYF80_032880 [Liparis tanakae]|uniref:Uncharacterized protein n=1 Tax=Liparis tanakae TaxID=230148 RepID=A0A4Z2GUI7_9TELE|nr:hypothetical protein EYF80_032880 [Liparis tanakae]